MPNGTKNARNGDLGLENRDFRRLLRFLNVGEGFGVNETSPQPLFSYFRIEGSCPGELSSPR